MFVRKLSFFFVCVMGMAVGSACAQSESRVRVVIPSIDEIENDLKWLIELSPTSDLKKQWKKLKEDLLDAFTQGIDLGKPMSVDLVFRKDELANEFRIPVLNLNGKNNGFLPSLKGIGFGNKLIVEGFYELSEKNKKPFYLRHDKGYAWIAGLKHAVPANPTLATKDLEPLLALKRDVVAELKNDAAGMPLRRENFKELRKQFEALIRFKRNEDPNAFELRKLALTQQLNEAERFLVETEQLQVSWTTNVATSVGRGELSLTALPETDLLKSLEQFAIKPSYFANVVLHDNPLVVGRLTFPLDAIRIEHLKEFYKAVRPVLESEIKTRPAPATEAQKTATKQATNVFLDLLVAGAELGVVDSFVDAHSVAPKKNVLVCGIRAANGKQADEIVKLIPELRAEWLVKLDAHEHGSVKIHELTVAKSRLAAFQEIFAGETVLYVGTSQDAVWGAAGVDSLTKLKAAIDQAAQPAPEKIDPVVVSYRVQVAKLVKLLEVIQREVPAGNAPLTKEQLQTRKDLEKYRKLASDAMSGCESFMHGELRRTDNRIEGYLELSECVLKYVGSMIADGAKQLQ